LVQVAGLKLVSCSVNSLLLGIAGDPQTEREIEKFACDAMRRGTPVQEQSYSTDRATKALNHLKANYC